MMLGITFLFGGILIAATAAAAPVIIHLIMRSKPREHPFPALRFVKKTHRATLSKLKLKHILLLLMRMAAIALIALLIARAQLPAWTSVTDSSLPVAAVFVIDDSASMGYRFQGRTLLARGQALSREVIDSLPNRSRVAVLRTSNPAAKVAFLGVLKLAAQQITEIEPTSSHAAVAPAVARAAAILQKIDLPRKEVYVVSDMTAQSWRDGAGVDAVAVSAGQDEPEVGFTVLDCSAGQGANVAIGPLRFSATQAPLGTKLTVETELQSAKLTGKYDVRVELAGNVVDHKAVSVRAGQTAVVEGLALRPARQGIAQGRVWIQQSDPLRADNVRYFTLEIGPPATALIVRDAATVGRRNETSFLVASAVAPGGSGAAGGIRRHAVTAERLTDEELRKAALVLLPNVSSLGPGAWASLQRFVAGGGSLWVIVGPLTNPTAYKAADAQKLMPITLGSLEALPKPIGWDLQPARHPMLAPFDDPENPPLSAIQCRQRFSVQSVAADATVVAAYADKVPAIVLRSSGRGTVLVWNFSPARSFSNLARLAQFPILVRRAMELMLGGMQTRSAYLWGSPVTLQAPRLMRSALVTARRPGQVGFQGVPAGGPGVPAVLPADEVGNWQVRFSEADRHVPWGFSVNVDTSESDLAPDTPEDVAKLFPADTGVVARSLDEIVHKQRQVTQPLDLAALILLVLLVLMTGESFFGNRFYRQAEQVNLE